MSPDPQDAAALTETAIVPLGSAAGAAAPTALKPLLAPLPAVHTTGAFDEETRVLLHHRLLVTHGTVGVVTLVLTVTGLFGIPIVPTGAGLGRWATGLPLLGFGQSLAGLLFLWWRPHAPLSTLRFVELTQFCWIALVGGASRLMTLSAPPAASPDPMYPHLVYRYDAILSNFPFLFAVIFYGVLIPNTRRRSLLAVAMYCTISMALTTIAVAVNPPVRAVVWEVAPVSVLMLFMALVVAVFTASRCTALRRQAFEARREAQQIGPYTLGRVLGKGGMGEVYLAEHRLLKRPCAVKFVQAELAADPSTAVRFEREVRAVTGLSHPNTVRIYDYGRTEDGSFYYVMEYLNGPTLDRLVRDYGPLAPARVVYLARQVCGALSEAHAAGLVHRDLKPGNVIVATLGGQRDVAKLLDFGLVQDHGQSTDDGRLTRTGTVLGTPAYMCPEQAAGESVDARGDIYSLGAVAFFMLTGRPPFEGTSVGKLLAAHLSQVPPLASDVRPGVPADLAAVVARCLAKSPADRYQAAADLDLALAGCECAHDWSSLQAERWLADVASRAPDATNADLTRTAVRT